MSVENRGTKEAGNKTAVNMAASIGSEVTKPNKDWLDLNNLDLSLILREIGRELGLTGSAWQAILIQSGSWIISNLENQVKYLQTMITEQETSISLRKTFGVPESDLALPVFATLAGMEARAREVLKIEAHSTTLLLRDLRTEILENLGLFLAKQLNELEEKEKALNKALEATQKETEGVEVLGGVKEISESRLKANLSGLERQKRDITDLFEELGGKVISAIRDPFETTVFSANQQSTAITAIVA